MYRTWHHMIVRCYSEKYQEKNPTYKGCSVCQRWLLLSNFVEDFKLIDGYDEELFLAGKLCLDKDIKSNNKNKCYCKNQCMLVSSSENTKQAWCGRKHKDETIEKMKNNRKGKNHPMYGKYHNEETKQKMSKANKGRKHTEETKKKMSKAIVQLDKYNKKIINIFSSLKDAENQTNIPHQQISDACRGKQKTSGGYIWMYKDTYELYKKLNDYSEIDKKTRIYYQ